MHARCCTACHEDTQGHHEQYRDLAGCAETHSIFAAICLEHKLSESMSGTGESGSWVPSPWSLFWSAAPMPLYHPCLDPSADAPSTQSRPVPLALGVEEPSGNPREAEHTIPRQESPGDLQVVFHGAKGGQGSCRTIPKGSQPGWLGTPIQHQAPGFLRLTATASWHSEDRRGWTWV
jgi:hypothetical protein